MFSTADHISPTNYLNAATIASKIPFKGDINMGDKQ